MAVSPPASPGLEALSAALVEFEQVLGERYWITASVDLPDGKGKIVYRKLDNERGIWFETTTTLTRLHKASAEIRILASEKFPDLINALATAQARQEEAAVQAANLIKMITSAVKGDKR